MEEPLILRKRVDDVVWLTLNQPASMNALSAAMLDELFRVVDDLHADGSVRCVVVTGAGKAFCAGGDLLGFQSTLADPDRLLALLRRGQEVFEHVERLPMPVIAAVNGYAVAGGLELMLCCDLVVAAESARLGDGHARYGVIPAGGSSVRLPRKIAANRANQLLLTAALLPARTLEQWGLVNLVVPDEELPEAAAGLARSVSQHSPLGLRVIKGLLANSLQASPEAASRAEIEAFAGYLASSDFAEGLRAFAEKRKPAFTGR